MSQIDYTKLRTERRVEKFREVILNRQKDFTVILENLNDPHNLSACLRSCDAVGIYEVNLVYYGAQPFPQLGKQSSSSAKKWVDSKRHRSVKECFEYVRSQGMKIYTTHMSSDAVSLYDLDFSGPVALMFGNEHVGVSEEALSLADGNFLIPQVGMIQSLNISVACAVSVYEAFRQRLQSGRFDSPDFTGEELEKELNRWLGK